MSDENLETRKEAVLPIVVSGEYKVAKNNCDSFHAFNDNGKKEIGGMNTKVNKVLMEVYDSGLNPDITGVEVTMNSVTMEVKWSVTIDESKEKKAWVGLYSRGGGAISKPGGYPDGINTKTGHASVKECKKSNYIRKRGTVGQMVPVYTLVHSPAKGCRVKQIFYKYELAEYPALDSTTPSTAG